MNPGLSPLQPNRTEARSRARLMVGESAAILKRFYFLERELIILQAGWLPGINHWETKLLVPELLWQSSVHASGWRERILELRYPERRIEVDGDAALTGFFRRFGDAPGATAFVQGLAHVVKPFILRAYQRYARLADGLDDGPTLFFLRHAIADLEQHVERLQAAAADALRRAPHEEPICRAWTEALASAVVALGDEIFFAEQPVIAPESEAILELSRPLRIDRTGGRDPRFRIARFAWPDRYAPASPGEGRQLQVRQAVHHINEVWAAEMAAACIHDLARGAPHEFLHDAARWCYDEIRHCRMGYERLKAWGYEDREIPLDTFSYAAGAETDPITRLGIIFFFETTYIHTKPERAKIFGEYGDRLSSHDMDFDWADELIHAHYGKKWLEHFLKAEADSRSPADIKQAARECVERLQASATSEDRRESAAIFESLMARALA